MQMTMNNLCKNCQNFLVFNDIAECDYEYFDNIKIDDAIIYVPEMFDCPLYEVHQSLVK